MKGYEHQAQYYETDQMGIIHHSNYIRWFESARIWYMNEIGVDYAEMERQGSSVLFWRYTVPIDPWCISAMWWRSYRESKSITV